MGPLVFRTALPFGYLIMLLGTVGLVLGGLAITVSALRRTPVRPVIALAGLIISAAAVSVLVVNIRAENDLDMTPMIAADNSLVGVWEGRQARLVLSRDGSYSCTGRSDCGALQTSGRWSRTGDFDISFDNNQSSVTYHIVKFRGVYRLIEMRDDPDLWNGSFLFEQTDDAS